MKEGINDKALRKWKRMPRTAGGAEITDFALCLLIARPKYEISRTRRSCKVKKARVKRVVGGGGSGGGGCIDRWMGGWLDGWMFHLNWIKLVLYTLVVKWNIKRKIKLMERNKKKVKNNSHMHRCVWQQRQRRRKLVNKFAKQIIKQ